MAISDEGNITVNRTGTTSLRFDTTGLIDPSTYMTVADLSTVTWSLKVDKEFTLALEADSSNPALRWFRFTADHAAQLAKQTRDYELFANFGNGNVSMARGKISAVGLA